LNLVSLEKLTRDKNI